MKIEVGKWYMMEDVGLGTHPFSAKVIKIGRFRVFCKWTTHDLDFDYDYEDCGWINKRRFICEEKDW